jgi:FMN hydrolase / 5-amino-6-(5-phospho-D-ribitylamino)uracil phosphatase
MISAVFFDGDQTLWDFQHVMQLALTATLSELQAARPGALSRSLSVADLTNDRNQVAKDWEGREFNLARLREWGFVRTLRRLQAGGPWTDAQDEVLAEQLCASYFEHRDRDPALFADTLPGLDALRPDYRLGLLSNGSRLPGQVGLDGYFEAVVFAQDHRVNKPDPEIFSIARGLMEVPADECVLIGDHPLNDVVGAKRAGWKAIFVDRGQGAYKPPDGYTDRPDATITTLEDLPDVLKNL